MMSAMGSGGTSILICNRDLVSGSSPFAHLSLLFHGGPAEKGRLEHVP